MRCLLSISAVVFMTIAGVGVHGGGNDCSRFDGNCFDCANYVSANNCGYCAAKAECMPGDEGGPSGGYTCDAGWSRGQSNCPATPAPTNTCSDFDGDCAACMSSHPLGHCGFCDSTKKCDTGNNNGPTGDRTCLSSAWFFDKAPSACPAPVPDCHQFDGQCDKCQSSLPQGHCGYCGNGKCLSGNVNGPSDQDCYTQWFWDSETCPTPAPPSPPTPAPSNDCAQYTGHCYECTTLAPDGNCGFCATTGICSLGGASGPNSGSCPANDWHYYGNNCPTVASGCNKFMGDCRGCVSTSPHGKCGFCGSDGGCFSGNIDGPSNHYCVGNWTWDEINKCPAVTPAPPNDCHAFDNNCGGCVTAPSGDCGYCSTGKCTKGSATGSSTCSATWYWDAASCPAVPVPVAHCASWTDCSACTNDPSGECGWCTTSNTPSGANGTCFAGTSNGPTTAGSYCNTDWNWYSGECSN